VNPANVPNYKWGVYIPVQPGFQSAAAVNAPDLYIYTCTGVVDFAGNKSPRWASNAMSARLNALHYLADFHSEHFAQGKSLSIVLGAVAFVKKEQFLLQQNVTVTPSQIQGLTKLWKKHAAVKTSHLKKRSIRKVEKLDTILSMGKKGK
jgi:hypothetical protein